MPAKLTQPEILRRFREKHGDRYDYSLVEYSGNKRPVRVRCKEHDIEFKVSPENHYHRGDGCPICGRAAQKTQATKPFSIFVTEAHAIHGDRYLYDETSYKNSRTKMRIRCPKHGWFLQEPQVHLRGTVFISAGTLGAALHPSSLRKRLQCGYDKNTPGEFLANSSDCMTRRQRSVIGTVRLKPLLRNFSMGSTVALGVLATLGRAANNTLKKKLLRSYEACSATSKTSRE